MNNKEYTNLVNIANRHNYLYYVASAPVISDAEFDAMLVQLQDYETAHPADILPDSPTQRVGSDLNGNGRALVAHRTPMLSQQKAHTFAEVEKWMVNAEKKVANIPALYDFRVTAMWKYDGISCSLVYVDGDLVSAATRGNGQKGQDLMQHVAIMASVPSHIEWKGRVELRGEIVCPKGQHTDLGYKDERTAASAICNAAYSDNAKSLVFYPWEIITANGSTSNLDNYDLPKFGFMESKVWHGAQLTQKFLDDRNIERAALDFPVDGLVFRLSSTKQFESMGATKHHPHGSIAYKFAAESATTTVENIEIKVAASGKRTPIAHITPVEIMGRTIAKVNLYSEKTMAKMGVEEGSTVTVALQNDVTPKIVAVEGFNLVEPIITPEGEENEPESDYYGENEEDAQQSVSPLLGIVAAVAICVAVVGVLAVGVGGAFFLAPLLGGAFKGHIA